MFSWAQSFRQCFWIDWLISIDRRTVFWNSIDPNSRDHAGKTFDTKLRRCCKTKDWNGKASACQFWLNSTRITQWDLDTKMIQFILWLDLGSIYIWQSINWEGKVMPVDVLTCFLGHGGHRRPLHQLYKHHRTSCAVCTAQSSQSYTMVVLTNASHLLYLYGKLLHGQIRNSNRWYRQQEQSANFSRLPFTSLTSTLSKSAQVRTFEAARSSSVLIKHLCACISSSTALSGNSYWFSLSQQWHSEVKTKTLLQSASCRLRCLSILLRLQLLQSFSPTVMKLILLKSPP